MRNVVLGLAVLSVMLVVQTPAQATLISGSLAITNGDKLFDSFTCSVVTHGGAGATPTDCTGVDVTAQKDSFGNFGIEFQAAIHDSTPGTEGDMLISYNVAVVGSPNLISDIHLSFNGNVTGSGFTEVVETVSGLIPATGIIGQASVTNPPKHFDDTIDLSTFVSKAHVQKDIQWGVGATDGTASISFIDQYVSQTGTVPEPGSMALLGGALVGLAALARRRRNA